MENTPLAEYSEYCPLWFTDLIPINISDFCQQVTDLELFTHPQTVRNFVIKCVKDGYIIRKGLGSKNIELADLFGLLNNGNILITLKLYHVDQVQKSNS